MNKIALITGGASGIGLATAKVLAKSGCKIIILGIDSVQLRAVKKELEAFGVSIEVFRCDVSKLADLEKVLHKVKKNHERIDYLVNCAGVSVVQKRGVINEVAYDRLLDVNLKGTYLSCMLFGYQLVAKNGSIVNIGSIRGRIGTDSFSAGYAAAKAGVINLTKTLAKELFVNKIRVNCVSPGAIYPTELSRSWTKSLRKNISKGILMNRLGKPEEVAEAIVFLLSDKASYITGQTIDVNGGQWMN